MRTISIINLKGGVGKTISAVNMAYILSTLGYKVLLIDNDKQGNASKILCRHGYGIKTIADVMTYKHITTASVIQNTKYEGLDIITANMELLSANQQVVFDQTRRQQDRIKVALTQVRSTYDFCIIDNAPDINISTINALTASNDVMIPVTIDDFSIDGLTELKQQIDNTREYLNSGLVLQGCFITQYDRTNEADPQGEEYLRRSGFPIFDTHIRKSAKVKQSTFAKQPLPLYSPRCGASRDYKFLVGEYLGRVEDGI